jgi:mono/diheme cytochrome c family protein
MRRLALTVLPLAALALVATGCGNEGVQVAKDSPYHHGAELFAENCSGCHSLDEAGTQGSATNVRDKERTDGPNFNQRKETVATVLYAIRNGGFSGAIMPENIQTGENAKAIAEFLAKYSGKEAKQAPTLQNTTEPGTSR